MNGHDEDCDEESLGDLDNDRDGFVDARCCNPRAAGGQHCGEDCDDSKRSVHPTSSEVCDGFDNNCDGEVDEGVAVPGFDDADFDTRGLRTAPRMGCPGTRGFAVYGGDCDDTNPAVNDLRSEVCDSVDNDCDTRTDEGALAAPWYVDADGDAYGVIDLFPVLQCTPPSA